MKLYIWQLKEQKKIIAWSFTSDSQKKEIYYVKLYIWHPQKDIYCMKLYIWQPKEGHLLHEALHQTAKKRNKCIAWNFTSDSQKKVVIYCTKLYIWQPK